MTAMSSSPSPAINAILRGEGSAGDPFVVVNEFDYGLKLILEGHERDVQQW